jgi:two-component system chemotaxis response regulator CheB
MKCVRPVKLQNRCPQARGTPVAPVQSVAISRLVVIGGSAGAFEAVRTILAALPPDLNAALFIVIHTSSTSPGVADQILSRRSVLPVTYAQHGERIQPAHVYIAPPDHHLVIRDGRMGLGQGPRENRFRPAVDPLFRTAARAYGPRVNGVVLSGGQDDGAAGLAAVKRHGGLTMVQDPAEASVTSMPKAALKSVEVDVVAPADGIARRIVELVEEERRSLEDVMPEEPRDAAETGMDRIHRADALGPPSPFTCPDCGGTLWQIEHGRVVQFQCHVGHRFGPDSLVIAQEDAIGQALWTALRAVEEHSELHRRMATRARTSQWPQIAEEYDARAAAAEARADILRRVLMPRAADERLRPAEGAAGADADS